MREEVNPNNGDAIRYHLCEKDENLVLREREVQRIAKHESMFERAKGRVEVIKDYDFIINNYRPLAFLSIIEAGSSVVRIIAVKFCPNCGEKVYYD